MDPLKDVLKKPPLSALRPFLCLLLDHPLSNGGRGGVWRRRTRRVGHKMFEEENISLVDFYSFLVLESKDTFLRSSPPRRRSTRLLLSFLWRTKTDLVSHFRRASASLLRDLDNAANEFRSLEPCEVKKKS